MANPGATKHCCWGLCRSDSRYPENLPQGTFFIRFPKPGLVKESMTTWEKNKQREKTDIAKRWLYACGRQDFTRIDQVKKDAYICSLHFVGGKGLTDENPHPLLTTLTNEEQATKLSRKRKPPATRAPLLPPQSKRPKITTDSFISSSVANDPPKNSICDEIVCEIAKRPEVRPTSVVHQETQTAYDKYILAAQVQSMVAKNQAAFDGSQSSSDKNEVVKRARKSLNPMSMDVIIANDEKTKYFIG